MQLQHLVCVSVCARTHAHVYCFSCVRTCLLLISVIDSGPNERVGELQGLNEHSAVDQQVYRQEAPLCSSTQLEESKTDKRLCNI